MARERGNWNVARLSPMILTGAAAIVLGLVAWAVRDLTFAVVVAVVILAVGLLGVWVLDKRRGRHAV
jgi:Flp pilus assembly protein TadB